MQFKSFEKMFSILFIILLITRDNFTNAAPSMMKENHCKNPDQKNMNERMIKMYNGNIEKIIEGIEYYFPTQKLYKHSIENVNIAKNHSYKTEGLTECSRSQSTVWHDETHKSTCPHHFVVVTREDLYPYSRKHAVSLFNFLFIQKKLEIYLK